MKERKNPLVMDLNPNGPYFAAGKERNAHTYNHKVCCRLESGDLMGQPGDLMGQSGDLMGQP